jgi:hypothetical protein
MTSFSSLYNSTIHTLSHNEKQHFLKYNYYIKQFCTTYVAYIPCITEVQELLEEFITKLFVILRQRKVEAIGNVFHWLNKNMEMTHIIPFFQPYGLYFNNLYRASK